MNRKKKKTGLKLKIAIIILLTFVLLVIGLFRYINSPKLQSIIYKSINQVSSLQIESAKLNLNILKRKITIKDVNLFNPKKDQRFRSNQISFKFRLLPLLRASIKISDLKINSLKVDLAKRAEEVRAKREKLSLANLLLMRNISVEDGVINNIEINYPLGQITSRRVDINFTPSLWGRLGLSLKIFSIEHKPTNKAPSTAEEIIISGATNVNNWIDVFPYVDDLSGQIRAKQVKLKNFDIETLDASLEYSGNKIKVSPLRATIGGHKVVVDGFIDGRSKKYSLKVNIPEPVYLPPLGGEGAFFDSSGNLKGEISISGKGLDYKTTQATASLDLNHTLSGKEPLPAKLTSQLNISNGVISIIKAILKVGQTSVNVKGSFNYVKPNLNLSFDGDKIPAETVMNRFKNKHYHPTKGVAKVNGNFSGWKPNFKFNLDVEASPASYYDMVVEHLKMNLNLTYNQLNLNGRIYQGQNETATVDLKISMGTKLADGTRHKKFSLDAKINNHDLTNTMAAYNLRGTGSGTLNLSGSPKSFTGSGHAEIVNGFLKGLGFTEASTDIKFATRKLIFDRISIATTETNPTTFPNPLVMDVTDYGVHFHGTPRAGLKIDAKYMSGSGQWQISKISYASLNRPEWESALSGTVSRDGHLNLRIKGVFDTSLLANLRGFVRETTGPAEINNLHVSGTSDNPSLSGSITLRDNTAQLRGWGYYVDKINGTIKLSGQTIKIPELTGRIEYGDFSLSGSLNHRNKSISHADVVFKGNSIRYATGDRSFRMEFDCDLKFAGSPNSSKLSGDISILDGRYTKNFSIFEKMKFKPAYKEAKIEEGAWKNMKLDLKVRSTGDLKIDNNLGEIWLSTDLVIKGTKKKPNFIGNIETVGGEINYAGLNFEVTRGFVEFRDPYTNPYIEFNAAKEVGDYNIVLTLRGRVDKLYLDLESTPPLDKQDILAILTFGVTKEELEEARFGYQIGTGLVAEQVGALLQGPIRKFTPIDRFKLEASPRGGDITRVDMAKDISDRMRFHLITDINTVEAVQTFQAEYLITDFLMLKGSRSTEADYRFNLTFRFREQ